MRIDRLFVPVGTDPYSLFTYTKHDVELRHHVTGDVIFKMDGAEVPEAWSTNARNVLISKYFRKAGVPNHTNHPFEEGVPEWLTPGRPCDVVEGFKYGPETSIKQVVRRIVGHWTYTGFKNGYFDADEQQIAGLRARAENPMRRVGGGAPNDEVQSYVDQQLPVVREENARAYYDEMTYMILNQMGAPNSPQWFNTGLWWAYGIEGPKQGHSYIDLPADTRMSVGIEAVWNAIAAVDLPSARKVLEENFSISYSQNAYQRVQAHACFILGVNDTMLGENGIYSWLEREARIFKHGSGSGINPSNLRGSGERLSGGGKSSGLMSWLKIGDASAGAIKSGGTTRRAAKMVTLDLDHPDILEFIDCKVDAELMVAAMHTGSKKITAHCQTIMDLTREDGGETIECKKNAPKVREAMKAAAADGVPHSYIDRAVMMAFSGYKLWPGEELDLQYEGTAYATVPFQNANHSVRIPSRFYEAVDTDTNWTTVYRTTGKVNSEMPARSLEERIAFAAWFCADPGVQFDTIINDWNVTPKDGQINASNPCSEHMRPDGSACNLASERLMKFVRVNDNKVSFDTAAFRHATHLWQMTLDITCTMAHLPDEQTAMSVWLHRDTGLGFADLGALIMSMGLAYDSDEGRAFAAVISAIMQGQCHLTSAQIAKALGSYPRFEANKEDHLRCVRNHICALSKDTVKDCVGLTVKPVGIDWIAFGHAVGADGAAGTLVELNRLWEDAYALGAETGFRNAEMTVIAPTGTIGITMDCDTTGVEPMLGLEVFKTLAGGGTMTIEPKACVQQAIRSLGYPADKVDEIAKGIIAGDPLAVKPQHQSVFDTSFPHRYTSRSIPWPAHVKMMAAVQAFISGAISKTVNMPYDATVDDIKLAYRMSHDLGVKALAVYRDGCKLSQPLNVPGLADGDDSDEAEETLIERTQRIGRTIKTLVDEARKAGLSSPIPAPARIRLPNVRVAGINVAAEIGSATLYVQTTRYDDGKLGEIWMTYSADQGTLQALLGQVCKLANIALQYGVPPAAVLKTMMGSNFEPKGLVFGHRFIKTTTSVLNLGARLIAYHELGDTSALNIQPDSQLTPEEEQSANEVMQEGVLAGGEGISISADSCPECGSHQYVPNGAGCKKCLQCGHAGGCG